MQIDIPTLRSISGRQLIKEKCDVLVIHENNLYLGRIVNSKHYLQKITDYEKWGKLTKKQRQEQNLPIRMENPRFYYESSSHVNDSSIQITIGFNYIDLPIDPDKSYVVYGVQPSCEHY